MEVAKVTNMTGKLPYVLAFAQDAAGDVYVLTSVTTGPERLERHDLQDRPVGLAGQSPPQCLRRGGEFHCASGSTR